MMTIEATTEDIHPLPMPAKIQPFFRGTTSLPPSVNHAVKPIPVRTKTGVWIAKMIETPALIQYKQDAALMLSQAYADWSLINAIRASKIKVPLAMEIRIYFPTMWKSDLDNREKYAVDVVFNKLQLNDNRVVDIHLTKDIDRMEPRVEIDVRCVVR